MMDYDDDDDMFVLCFVDDSFLAVLFFMISML